MVALFEPSTYATCRGHNRDGSKCTRPVRFANTTLCEDCWAIAQWINGGWSQRVRLERVNYEDD